MTLMVKVESQVCVRVDSHGVRVISQPVQVISKQSASCRLCGVPPFSQREYQLNTGIPPPHGCSPIFPHLWWQAKHISLPFLEEKKFAKFSTRSSVGHRA